MYSAVPLWSCPSALSAALGLLPLINLLSTSIAGRSKTGCRGAVLGRRRPGSFRSRAEALIKAPPDACYHGSRTGRAPVEDARSSTLPSRSCGCLSRAMFVGYGVSSKALWDGNKTETRPCCPLWKIHLQAWHLERGGERAHMAVVPPVEVLMRPPQERRVWATVAS